MLEIPRFHCVTGKQVLLVGALLLCCALLSSATLCASGNDTTVVFRYDDYSQTSDTRLAERIIGALERRGMCATFAVIPYIYTRRGHGALSLEGEQLDHARLRNLRSAVLNGTIEVALHGFNHQSACIPRMDGGKPTAKSEFSGVDYSAQLARISRGKKSLERGLGVTIRTFVPPWNTYDTQTLRALNQMGFERLSAGYGGTTDGVGRLKLLPCTTDLLHVRAALDVASSIPGSGKVIVVLFHPYDFVEVDRTRGVISFSDFERMLDYVDEFPGIRVSTLSGVQCGSLDAKQYSVNQTLNESDGSWTLMPQGIRPKHSGVYVTTQNYYGLMAAAYLLSGIVCLATVSAGAAFGRWTPRAVTGKARRHGLARRCLYIACVGGLIYGLRDGRMGFAALAICLFVGGVFLADRFTRVRAGSADF